MTVQIGRDALPLRAVADERRELLPRLCERNRMLERLQRRAGRELPLVRLVDSADDPHASSVLHPDAARAAHA